jgi:hypothetical protein
LLPLAYWVLGLAPVVAVIYLVWAYRKKAAAQAAATSERFERLFGASSRRLVTADAASSAAEVAARQTPAVPASGRTLSYARKERLLNPHQAQLFHALKTALPDYEVLAQISLAGMIEVSALGPGREREQRLRALTQHVIDCAVCSRDMQVIAAVDLEAGSTAESRFRSECLKAAGVRYICVNPAALPGREEVRALVIGV